MQQSLTKAQEIKIDNGLVLASERKLGQELPKTDIENIARRTTEPDVAARLMARYSAAPDPESYLVIARLVLGLCSSYCARVALDGVAYKHLPVVLTAYFMNRISLTSDNALVQIVNVDTKPSFKLFSMFESYWSSIDTEELMERSAVMVSESSDRVSFRRIKLDSVNAYSVHKGSKHCGNICWDKELKDPSDEGQGWRVTLFDGYPTTKYSEERTNPHDPFMAVSKGELKLHNPQRMSLKSAQSWARGAMK